MYVKSFKKLKKNTFIFGEIIFGVILWVGVLALIIFGIGKCV